MTTRILIFSYLVFAYLLSVQGLMASFNKDHYLWHMKEGFGYTPRNRIRSFLLFLAAPIALPIFLAYSLINSPKGS